MTCASRFENRCKSEQADGAAVGDLWVSVLSGDAAAFRPMTLCKSTPSPGDGTDIQHELLGIPSL